MRPAFRGSHKMELTREGSKNYIGSVDEKIGLRSRA